MDSSSHVTVLLFSALREKLGFSRLELDASMAHSVGEALSVLSAAHPAIAEYRPWIRPAVNRGYATDDTALVAGDELALITPVSGG
ncbi:MAG: molybdopterin converting factor small subunit [Rhodothermales bacterium]|jgi:molybdopterin converting factor small subunit